MPRLYELTNMQAKIYLIGNFFFPKNCLRIDGEFGMHPSNLLNNQIEYIYGNFNAIERKNE